MSQGPTPGNERGPGLAHLVEPFEYCHATTFFTQGVGESDIA
jgi:hypothetical protein